MKRTITALLAAVFIIALGACGETASETQQSPAPTSSAAERSSADGSSEPVSAGPGEAQEQARQEETGGTLVVYFSATGTTRGVAEKIAAVTDADVYEIKAAQEYADADLNWHDSGSRTTLEQNDKSVRPEIGSGEVSIEGYTVVYIGYPIWWGEEPRIMDTFVESHDFDGITVIPFCTSSSSGIGASGKNLAENAASGNWLDGKRFGAGVSQADIKDWIDSLR